MTLSATTLHDTPAPSSFPATLWTVVHRASSREPERARAALGELCVMYRQPARAWLIRTGTPPQDADDLIQSFLADLLHRNPLDGYVRGSARFRSYFLECLKRFRRNEWRRLQAMKRGAGTVPVSLEDHEPGLPDRIDHSLDAEFALEVHRRASARIQRRFEEAGTSSRLESLRPFLFGSPGGESYQALGLRLGLKEGAVKKAVFDLRNEYYDAFRSEVLPITADTDSWMEEMRYLIGLLASHPPERLHQPPANGSG